MPSAAEAKLKVGDPAPPLDVGEWIQGVPVDAFARGQVYIIEFWATWCGPCRFTIRHLNNLHLEFGKKGLVVIGQNVWERQPELIKPFVQNLGTQMQYRVVLDKVAEEGKGRMDTQWMEAAGQTGIPTAFIVNQQGTIAWIGPPSKITADLVQQILDGNFNISRAADDYVKSRETDAQVDALWKTFNEARGKEQWDAAEKLLEQMEQLLPQDDRVNLGPTRFNFHLSRNQYSQAYRFAKSLSDLHPDNVMIQNGIAWTIATRDDLPERNLDLAEQLARRASAAADHLDEEVLDTLAFVLFVRGQIDEAITCQERSVSLAEGSRKTKRQTILDDYRAGRLPLDQRLASVARKFRTQLKEECWDAAEKALNDWETLLPEAKRTDLVFTRFRFLLKRQAFQQAYGYALEISQQHRQNVMLLNELAWIIATEDEISQRDLETAEKIARTANEASDGQNAEILDTLARVLFLRGQPNPAITYQEKAVEFAKGRRKEQFQETLDSYKNGQTPKPY